MILWPQMADRCLQQSRPPTSLPTPKEGSWISASLNDLKNCPASPTGLPARKRQRDSDRHLPQKKWPPYRACGLPEQVTAHIREDCGPDITVLEEPYNDPSLPGVIDAADIGVTGISFAIAQSERWLKSQPMTQPGSSLACRTPISHSLC